MIADLGAKYCIVGHSERRADNGDTDELVHDKIRLLLDRGITPILCVGESLEQRDRGLTMEHISYQIKAALYDFTPEEIRRTVIAYEPIWAIGTGLRRCALPSASSSAGSTARSSPARSAFFTADR